MLDVGFLEPEHLFEAKSFGWQIDFPETFLPPVLLHNVKEKGITYAQTNPADRC